MIFRNRCGCMPPRQYGILHRLRTKKIRSHAPVTNVQRACVALCGLEDAQKRAHMGFEGIEEVPQRPERAREKSDGEEVEISWALREERIEADRYEIVG